MHEEECLGACEQAPVVQVNFLNYARMDQDRRGAATATRSAVEALVESAIPAKSTRRAR